MFDKVHVGNKTISPIDWEMTPDLSFGTYESWGGRERVRNNSERVYYFFVDNWGETPKLCLMERGVKHARVLAEILAPESLVRECVERQGSSSRFEKSYAIDNTIKTWLREHVLEGGDDSLVKPLYEDVVDEDMGTGLPLVGVGEYVGEVVKLPSEYAKIDDDQIGGIITKWNLYDGKLNPQGSFHNVLVDNGDSLTVTDQRTGLMWQRGGIDICSIRSMRLKIQELNAAAFAGYSDWRLPTMEEAMSLMRSEANSKDMHLDLCFSKEQPFIFVAAQRQPGGYWFVDYKQGQCFWSSGTIPGGFGRLCRSLT